MCLIAEAASVLVQDSSSACHVTRRCTQAVPHTQIALRFSCVIADCGHRAISHPRDAMCHHIPLPAIRPRSGRPPDGCALQCAGLAPTPARARAHPTRSERPPRPGVNPGATVCKARRRGPRAYLSMIRRALRRQGLYRVAPGFTPGRWRSSARGQCAVAWPSGALEPWQRQTPSKCLHSKDGRHHLMMDSLYCRQFIRTATRHPIGEGSSASTSDHRTVRRTGGQPSTSTRSCISALPHIANPPEPL